jgi:cell wall-associated NlpC family hydrolase
LAALVFPLSTLSWAHPVAGLPEAASKASRATVHEASASASPMAAVMTAAPRPVAASTTTPTVLAAPPLYEPGDRGPAVARIQQLLNQHGAHLAVDGIFGPQTEAAVKAFQRAQHLAVDGIVGPQTLSRLQALPPPTSSSVTLPAEAPPATLLEEGMSGPAVASVQQSLAQLGFYHGAVDGIFGPETEAAVRDFQAAAGIAVDGIVGPQTLSALAAKGAPVQAGEVSRGVASATGQAVAGLALGLVGDAYQWGGTSPSTGFDCSGLVQYVFSKFGISLPRTSYEQWNQGTPVSYQDLAPGDLVFFDADGPGASHVGIYVGNGAFVSADDPSSGVRVNHLSNPWWMAHFLGGRQLVP